MNRNFADLGMVPIKTEQLNKTLGFFRDNASRRTHGNLPRVPDEATRSLFQDFAAHFQALLSNDPNTLAQITQTQIEARDRGPTSFSSDAMLPEGSVFGAMNELS